MFGWFKREPKSLIERRQQMFEALADYPLYDPPHRQGPNGLRQKAGQTEDEHIRLYREFVARGRENFDHFMKQRPARLDSLYAFLGKFDVKAELQDDGLAAVSNWFSANAFALVGDVKDERTVQAFYQMQTPWTQGLRGFNLVFDLGIFLGECLIEKQPRLHWNYQFGASDDGFAALTGYAIEGFRPVEGGWLDPPQYIFGRCGSDLNGMRSGRPLLLTRPNFLVGVVRDYSRR